MAIFLSEQNFPFQLQYGVIPYIPYYPCRKSTFTSHITITCEVQMEKWAVQKNCTEYWTMPNDHKGMFIWSSHKSKSV